jgi:hypothetical protein
LLHLLFVYADLAFVLATFAIVLSTTTKPFNDRGHAHDDFGELQLMFRGTYTVDKGLKFGGLQPDPSAETIVVSWRGAASDMQAATISTGANAHPHPVSLDVCFCSRMLMNLNYFHPM